MKNQTGYKQMLRDRCPKVVNCALKWCKSKEAWLNHVYENSIWIYSSNEERLKETRSLLGLDKNPKVFVFEDTILWDNFTPEETKHWKKVCNWVSWFQKEYAYVENTYTTSKSAGKDKADIKFRIMSDHLIWLCPTADDDTETRQQKNKYINDFADFLIDCFENRI